MKIYAMPKLVGLSLVVLLLCLSFLSSADYEPNVLSYFRAIEEKNSAVIKNPSSYNRLRIKISNREYNYYVEQNPAHVVPTTAIEVIKVVKSWPEVSDGTQGTQTTSKPNVSKRLGKKVFYSVNFTIMPVEAKRFVAFVNKNKEESFQVKVGDQSLGVTQFYWPDEINKSGKLEFTMMLIEDNPNEIKKLLARVSDKVVWQ